MVRGRQCGLCWRRGCPIACLGPRIRTVQDTQLAGNNDWCRRRQVFPDSRFWSSHTSSSHRRRVKLKVGLHYIAPLLAVGRAAVVVAAVPIAAATPTAPGDTGGGPSQTER